MRKNKTKRSGLICLALAVVMAVTLMPMTRAYAETTPAEPLEQAAAPQAAAVMYNGNSYETLKAALDSVNNSDGIEDVLVLERDILIDGAMETGVIDKNITLDLNGYIIGGSASGALVQVTAGKTLQLLKGGITNTSDSAGAIAVSGAVTVPVNLVITPAGTWQSSKAIQVIDKKFAVNVTTKMNGTVSAAGGSANPKSTSVVYGSDLVLDITPQPGYEVKSVIVNGVYRGKENQLTLSKISADQSVVVDFAPRSFYIMLDPGHGSSEINMVGTYKEHERMWVLTNYLKEELEKFLGFVVDLTKKDVSETPGVYQRGTMSEGYDLLISMHSNWADVESADYPLAIVSSGTALYAKANPIGTKLASTVKNTMGTSNSIQVWTKKQSDGTDWYGVIRGAASVGTPAVILEHSFHSNTKARNWMLSDANLRKMAVAEAATIASHFGLTTKAASVAMNYSPSKKGVTLTNMTVYKDTSASSGGIGIFRSGTALNLNALVIAPDGSGWYMVYTNSQYGYILEKDVRLLDGTLQAATQENYSPSKAGITSKYMTVRSKPLETSAGIGTFLRSTPIKLNGLYTGADGIQWYMVYANGQNGYVLAREVYLGTAVPPAPVVPTPPVPQDTYTAYSPSKLSLALTGMTVYSQPVSSSSGIGTFQAGTVLRLNGLYTTSAGVKWYKVYTNGKYGYIAEKNVTFLTYTAYSPSKVAATNVNMVVRSTLSTSSVGIGTFRAGTTIKLNGLYAGANGVQWYMVYTNGKYGYILAKDVTLK